MPDPFPGCTVSRSRVTRVRLVGPAALSEAVAEDLARLGYTVVRTGAYTDRRLFPRIDPTRFLIEAEREDADAAQPAKGDVL